MRQALIIITLLVMSAAISAQTSAPAVHGPARNYPKIDITDGPVYFFTVPSTDRLELNALMVLDPALIDRDGRAGMVRVATALGTYEVVARPAPTLIVAVYVQDAMTELQSFDLSTGEIFVLSSDPRIVFLGCDGERVYYRTDDRIRAVALDRKTPPEDVLDRTMNFVSYARTGILYLDGSLSAAEKEAESLPETVGVSPTLRNVPHLRFADHHGKNPRTFPVNVLTWEKSVTFTAAPSPEGRHVAVWCPDVNGEYSLIVLDTVEMRETVRMRGISIAVSPLSSFRSGFEMTWIDENRLRFSETAGPDAAEGLPPSDRPHAGDGCFRFVDVDVRTGERIAVRPYARLGLRHEKPPVELVDADGRREDGPFVIECRTLRMRTAHRAVLDLPEAPPVIGPHVDFAPDRSAVVASVIREGRRRLVLVRAKDPAPFDLPAQTTRFGRWF